MVNRTLNAIAGKLRSLAGRGNLTGCADVPGDAMRCQITTDDGGPQSNVPYPQNYGLASRPPAGCKPFLVSNGGAAGQAVIVAMCDVTWRIALMEGEAAIYDDLGQSVHLTREGIVVKGAGKPVTITDTPKVRAECAILECTGDILDHAGTGGKTMATMRETYNTHTHSEHDNGGPTGAPGQEM